MSGSRHGRHHPDKVQFGGMVWPEFKAVAQLLALRHGCTIMDVVRRGVTDLATAEGVVRNGEVVPEFREKVSELAGSIRKAALEKRETFNSRKEAGN